MRLRKPLRVFRIADARRAIFDGSGPARLGGRWNSPGRRVIYAAETYAGALLEILAHANIGRIPKNHGYVEIVIPTGMTVEVLEPNHLADWDAPDLRASRAYGDAWYDERRTAVLLVPSVVTRVERNVVLNEEHPDFRHIAATPPQPVFWDQRLFPTRR